MPPLRVVEAVDVVGDHLRVDRTRPAGVFEVNGAVLMVVGNPMDVPTYVTCKRLEIAPSEPGSFRPDSSRPGPAGE